MRIAAFVAVTALFGQSASAGREDLKSYTFTPPAQGLTLWLPSAYVADAHVARKYARVPSVDSPDFVTVRMEYSTRKRPEPPLPPTEADLLKVEPSLTNLKFTPGVSVWRGRSVSEARYEGFVLGKLGVYGRMVWLPLEPGTVVLHLYAEPAWEATMNRDLERILWAIEGEETSLSLRERAPQRWVTSLVLGGLGCLVALTGVIMIIARMNEAFGGAVVPLGLVLPVVPLGYALFHLPECRRGLLVFLAGAAIFGASLLVAR